MKTFLFPGQGSQVRGMGGGLFDEFPELTNAANDILGYSIEELCLFDPRHELNLTQFTQPAIYVVNALSYLKRMRARGAETPDRLAGHSLGEFNALMAAGCFSFEQGLRIVKKRGELMSRAGAGAMAAIMEARPETVETILQEQGAVSIDIAIYNSPLQSVIAGPKDDLARIEPHFRSRGISYYPLNTSGAFHSRYMKAASIEFRQYLLGLTFMPLRGVVIANVSAAPYNDSGVIDNLVNQLTHPVRWLQSMQRMLSIEGMQFEEIGDADVLLKLLKKITGQSRVVAKLPRSEPQMSAAEKVAAWNETYPIGTTVRASLIPHKELITLTEARLLFGRRPAIYLQGYDGYFDLDRIEAVQALHS